MRGVLKMLLRARARLSALPAGFSNDVFWLAGAGLVAYGAALERLSAGLIVGGLLLLVVGVGSVTRDR